MIHEQNDSINKDNIIKRNQLKILELKIEWQLKNSLKEFNSILEQAQKRISKLEEKTFEIIKFEEQKEKKNEWRKVNRP